MKFFFADETGRLVLPRQQVSSLDWSDGRPVAKDYTPVRHDPEKGEIDFDFVRHDGGVASTWAENAVPGDSAWIAGPKMSHSHPEGADWILVVGDETALPAIGRWLAEMPEGTKARVFVEVGRTATARSCPPRPTPRSSGSPGTAPRPAPPTSWSRPSAPPSGCPAPSSPGSPARPSPSRASAATWRRSVRSRASRPTSRGTGAAPRPPSPSLDPASAEEPPEAPVVTEEDEDAAHERLHELTDLAPPTPSGPPSPSASSTWSTGACGAPPRSPGAPGRTRPPSGPSSTTSWGSNSSPPTARATTASPRSARSSSRTTTRRRSTTWRAPRPRSTPPSPACCTPSAPGRPVTAPSPDAP